MVGFFGFSRASAAACTPLAPEWCWATGGREKLFSGIECRDEVVEADADGEPPDLPVALGGLLFVGAAMFQATECLLFRVHG